ncbi:MAG: hypothetical protein NT084_04310 [Bacteroidetes bacterium]|nr:hypothetical protein [Bacteroidota bacterium]
MNEPKHPHFVLADATYCHVLEDRLFIGKRILPEKFPEPINRLDFVTFILQMSAILILMFFIVVTLITHFYVVTFTLSLLFITLGIALLHSAGFTATKTIMIADIVGVAYTKKLMGFDYFIVRYTGPEGKVWKRRLAIYDSHRCLDQALQVMKDAKLLK